MTAAGAYINPVEVRPGWPRINPITGVLIGALAVQAVAYIYIVFGLNAPAFLLIAPAVCTVVGAVAVTGRRWSAIPAAAVVALNLAVEVPNIVAWHVHDVEGSGAFATNVVIIPVASIVTIATGVLFTVRAYRGQSFTLPAWSRFAGVAAAAVAFGGSAVAFAPHYGAPARVSAEAVESLPPSVVMASDEFVQQEIRVKAGEVVQWRVANADSYEHTFDLDGYGVHMTVPGGESGFVMFVADQAGEFAFNCNIPGHTMSGKLVVE